MAELNVTQRELTPTQLWCVLSDIATSAKSMNRFTLMLDLSDDERDLDALKDALKSLSERVGFLADMAANHYPLGATFSESAAEWMMPAIFHHVEITPSGDFQ